MTPGLMLFALVAGSAARGADAPGSSVPAASPAVELTAEQDHQRFMSMKVALTFDDIPAHGVVPPGKTRLDVARSLVDALQAGHAPPAYAFLNAKSLQDAPETAEVLRLWREAGHPLANHTFSHMDLEANTVEAFEQDILANEPALRASMGESDWHWFRYPYLHEGQTSEKREAVAGFLGERGYRIADVSLSFDDWAYTDPYARCLAKNDASAVEWLKTSYLERAAASLARATEEARRVPGRDVSHVMLLHFGGVQAGMLPKLLELLRERGFELVTLAEARSRPADVLRAAGAAEASAAPPDQPRPEGYAAPSAPPSDDLFARLSALCR